MMRDLGWRMRDVRDHAPMFARNLLRYYQGAEDWKEAVRQRHAGLRVTLYEAVRRNMMDNKVADELPTAYASVAQVLMGR